MANQAVGFIEAEGFVPIFDAVDAMAKATDVEIRGVIKVGGGLVSVAIAGDLATVEEAADIGEETARAVSGRAVSSIVFASPSPPVAALGLDPQAVLPS
ncbi:BMC domain-containing protein [Pseudonocardia asaccharolytica]|uniref:Carboxysome shell protein n=1 Tax=Pseudonocardia asaccharolytica DSM 44247 = NBRC 16224 TaxID=1123024 RepID=A0A511D2T3_9PSEU|nr:BMC domain-containing protein [Pseudonocardia asaccharolytica]GEL17208.1 carboxysome shell protein [Pseudonocardia asaccharolytica DSM 44247 = NBRC 16224]